MSQFDRDIIREHADRLYFEAALIVWLTSLLGAALGLAAWFFAGRMMDPGGVGALFGPGAGLLGGLVGWAVGSDKAFSLRLQAQIALCLAQIEENTRVPAAEALGS